MFLWLYSRSNFDKIGHNSGPYTDCLAPVVSDEAEGAPTAAEAEEQHPEDSRNSNWNMVSG